MLHRIAGARADRLIEVTGGTVRGVVYGLLGTAIVQGMLTAFGLWITGVPRPVLLGVIAGGFVAVLPIGAPLVWIPAALWLISSGRIVLGDFLRSTAWWPLVRRRLASSVPTSSPAARKLPFLLTVLGVLGGALAFGLLGIFVGPVLLGMGFALVNEWSLEEERAPLGPPAV